MPYNPTSWSLGDTITAALLNKLEGGVQDAHAGDLDAGAIGTDELADAAVTALKLAAAAVSNDNVANDAGIDASKLADGSVSNAAFEALKNVTSDIQAQLDAKEDAGAAIPAGVITLWSGSASSVPAGWFLCDGGNGTPDLTDRFVVGAGVSYAPGDEGGAERVSLSEGELAPHTHGAGGLGTLGAGGHSHDISIGAAGSHTHNAFTELGGEHDHDIESALIQFPPTFDEFGNIITQPLLSSIDFPGTPNYPKTRYLLHGYFTEADPDTESNTELSDTHFHEFTTNDANDHTHDYSLSSVSNHTHQVNGTTGSAGSGASHENRPPYYALAYIMKG